MEFFHIYESFFGSPYHSLTAQIESILLSKQKINPTLNVR
jgi:hypothetical protein